MRLATIRKGNYMNITILKDGPILIDGPVEFKVEGDTGFVNMKGSKIALCRCANSENKPFCDGSHKDCNFNDPQYEIITG